MHVSKYDEERRVKLGLPREEGKFVETIPAITKFNE
jgi:hypothetical protein